MYFIITLLSAWISCNLLLLLSWKKIILSAKTTMRVSKKNKNKNENWMDLIDFPMDEADDVRTVIKSCIESDKRKHVCLNWLVKSKTKTSLCWFGFHVNDKSTTNQQP